MFNNAIEKKNTTEHHKTVNRIELKGNVNLQLKKTHMSSILYCPDPHCSQYFSSISELQYRTLNSVLSYRQLLHSYMNTQFTVLCLAKKSFTYIFSRNTPTQGWECTSSRKCIQLLSFTEPLWLPHIRSVPRKIHASVIKLVSSHNHKVVIGLYSATGFLGRNGLPHNRECSR